MQSYQKRGLAVVDWLIDLAGRSQRRLMVRLVKGAYWDSEIKRAQQDGLADYPVFTRKAYTDASYIACARRLLAAPDAVYPQFATHNAHTLAAVYELADPQRWSPRQYEFQCLHGMGEPLYEQVVGAAAASGRLGRPCRIYAPVGSHETLLAYLVRRLLENGANTSFVNRVGDTSLSVEDLVRDPVELIDGFAQAEGQAGLPHRAIALPARLYGERRVNSSGVDFSSEAALQTIAQHLHAARQATFAAPPLLAADTDPATPQAVTNPADRGDVVGTWRECTPDDVAAAIAAAQAAAPGWAAQTPQARAAALAAGADRLQADQPRLMALLMREAGKTAANAAAEVREAVDFLRYYAQQVGAGFDNASHRPLGVVACISPWNFPLAIFTGQVAAALAAGNVVLAKPAEQTPLVAAEAVRALWAAGVPRAALQLLPGRGAVVGARLVDDARVQGVLFTGSTEVARRLQRATIGRVDRAGRALALIAETGGQNAMVVDSSALVEQVVADVLSSAFDSAGQRCSALRVLCVQHEVADRLLEMLLGAMAELRVGDPTRLATDVGPVIADAAKANIDRHVDALCDLGQRVHQRCARPDRALNGGSFVLPTLIEIDSLAELQREVFGPVLHFLRYRRNDLDELVSQINATGYALTLGLHTRIDETIARVVDAARAGNVYVNRNMVGAVVGVQPFGGEGLSGTGPKAGGPLYLYRLLSARPEDVLARALAEPTRGAPAAAPPHAGSAALRALSDWAVGRFDTLPAQCSRLAGLARSGEARLLPGPTGERNLYRIVPRAAVLCLAAADGDRLLQLAAVLASGGRAVWPLDAEALLRRLPAEVQAQVALVRDWRDGAPAFDSVLLHGSTDDLAGVQRTLAARPGALVAVERLAPGDSAVPMERLVVERALSINTAAAGGNAALMSVG